MQLDEVGEPRLSVTLYLWEPTNDLNAYAGTRKQAWDASGFSVLSEEYLSLADGRPAARFVVQTMEGQAFFFFTTLSDRYLQLAGDSQLDLLAEISQTVRPIEGGA